MAEAFAKGDVVQLKSGGPLMTVTDQGPEYMTGTEKVFCMWFEKTKQQQGAFVPEALKKAAAT